VFYKIQGISEQAEEFTTFQEGLCSLELSGEMQTSHSRADEHPSFSKVMLCQLAKLPVFMT
jgi:hypothetical protein